MFEQSLEEENSKQKEQLQYLVIMLLIGVGYYLFFFLPEQRNEAKKEIEAVFKENSPVIVDDLDSNLWKGFKTWQERLDKLYFPSPISKFKETMQEAIETRKKELEIGKARNLQEAKDNAIKSIEEFAKKEIEKTPSFGKEIKKF